MPPQSCWGMKHISIVSAALLLIVPGCSNPRASSQHPSTRADASAPAEAAAPTSTASQTSLVTPPNAGLATTTGGPPRLAIEPDGLRLFLQPSGASRALPFGMDRAEVFAPLEKVLGLAAKRTNADCGAGPVEFAGWPDGLSLLFQHGRFVGWGLDSRAKGGVTTADGIGIGSTQADLDDAMGPPVKVLKSTLGTEFSVGEFHGLFESGTPSARITDMWVGVSCVAR